MRSYPVLIIDGGVNNYIALKKVGCRRKILLIFRKKRIEKNKKINLRSKKPEF
jgi:hypothetical protein